MKIFSNLFVHYTDDSELYIQGNLAHAYLLTGDFEKANAIYQKYRGENIDEKTSWEKMVANDFASFKKKGISHPKFQEILDSFKIPKE